MVPLELNLQNMVSRSCIKLLTLYFDKHDNAALEKVTLGRVKLLFDESKTNQQELEKELKELGFPTIQDPDEKLVEDIKIAAIELIHYAYNANSLIRNSDYLSEKLLQPYSKLSKVFSDKSGMTLEKYLIMLKIEKVKELLLSDGYTLSEIAFMFGYSSVQYLSNQFKKTTGITVSEFRENPDSNRVALEDILPSLDKS